MNDLVPVPASTLGGARKPRLLWASVYCLLDTSSGASMAVREMLLQLARSGYEISILGATVFDHERGTAGMLGQWSTVQGRNGRLVELTDTLLEHRLYVTASTSRELMTSREESAWYSLYEQALALHKPDVVFYYGGQAFDLLIAAEARARHIPVAFYLANGSYSQARWCRDVDLILTDSQATAQMYEKRLGVRPTPIGAFIDPTRVVPHNPDPNSIRKHILFINPIPEKGAGIVVRLAMLLEKRRPDMVFEVVESRGKWADMLRLFSSAFGEPRESLDNVIITPNSADMRPIYGRARLLLAPGLWWESSGRVLVEAMLNGIPAIISDQGGMPEMVQNGGVVLKFGAAYYQAPYTTVPADAVLEPLLALLQALFDDESRYAALAACAQRVGQTQHHLQTSTQRLLQALQPLVEQGAGDADTGLAVRTVHKHGLDDRAKLLKSG